MCISEYRVSYWIPRNSILIYWVQQAIDVLGSSKYPLLWLQFLYISNFESVYVQRSEAINTRLIHVYCNTIGEQEPNLHHKTLKQDYKPNIHAYNTRKQYTFGYSHHPPSRAKWPMRALCLSFFFQTILLHKQRIHCNLFPFIFSIVIQKHDDLHRFQRGQIGVLIKIFWVS